MPLKLQENPLLRMLAVVVMIAAGIRLIFWLLIPVLPYLAAALVVFTVVCLTRWYRGRW